MKRLPFIFIFFLVVMSVRAQTISEKIRGRVVDSQTEAPLTGAVVRVSGSNPVLGATTDEDGIFSIENVPVGRQSIEVSYIGYLPYKQENIFITSTKQTFLDIKLEESVTSLGEVVISQKLKKEETINPVATVSARTFSIEETERYSGSIGDPARMASNFAGIATICDQRNDIVIRGNSPLGVLWRLDGIDIPNPNHFASFGASGGPISILNNNLLTNSDFFTGAFPSEYGNALSGVFDLKMRSGNNLDYEFVTQVGMNGFELGAEGPIKYNRSSFLANYRYSTLAIVDAMGFNVGIDDIPYFQDASFKLTSGTTRIGTFSLIGIGGYSYVRDWDSKEDISNLPNGKGEDYTFGTGMGAVGLIHKLVINKRVSIENSLSGSYTLSKISRDGFTVTNPVPAIIYRQKSDESGITLATNVKYKTGPKDLFQSGLSLQMLNFQFIDSIKSGNQYNININREGTYDLLQYYAQWQHKFNDDLLIYQGMHFSFFTFNNSFVADPRIGAKWNFREGQSLNFGFGLHSQLIPRMFYIVGSETVPSHFDGMNQKLGFSRSVHLVLGYNWLIRPNLRLKLETYYQHLYNIAVKQNQPAYSILNFGDNYFNHLPVIDSLEDKGTGRNYGIEMTVERFLYNGWYGLITASAYQSKYKGYDGIERNTAFNGNFIINTLAGKEFRLGKNNFISLNLKLLYAGSLRIVPFEIVKVSTNYYRQVYDWERAYESRRNDYFRLNGRVGYKLIRPKFSAELSVDLMNMTNHRDIFTENFNSSTGTINYSYQFPFMPIGFLRFQF